MEFGVKHRGLNLRRGIYFTTAGTLFFTAFSAQNTYFLFISEAMLGMSLLSLILLQKSLQSLEIFRHAPLRGFPDMEIEIELEIHYHFFLPLCWLNIQDIFSPHYKPQITLSLPLLKKGKTLLRYKGLCHRGRGKYELGPITVEFLDYLGIWQLSKTFDVRDEFVILPQTIEISSFSIGGNQTRSFGSSRSIPKAGSGYDFLGTREYRPGDSLKFIHWPATAHHGEWIVKEFEVFTLSHVSFFIDLSYKALQGFKPNTLDYSIQIIASLAQYIAHQGHSFRLFGKSQNWISFPFGKSSSHLAWLLEEMALMKPTGDTPFDEVLSHFLPILDIGEEIILVVPTHAFRLYPFLALLPYLQGKNIKTTLIFLVSQSFEHLHGEREDYLSHSQASAILSKKGISLYAVEKGKNIDHALRREMVL